MRFAKLVYLVAGIYGLIVLIPQYFLEDKTGRDYPPAITHPEFYYGFVGIAVAWQIAFLVVSSDPGRFRAIMIPAILEKLTFGVAVIVLFVQHKTSTFTLTFATIDLILGALFCISYVKTKVSP